MSVEQPPNGAEAQGVEKVTLKFSQEGSLLWYYDSAGNVVVLDEAGEAELNRQQEDPESPPVEGYPQFERAASFENLPHTSPEAGTPNNQVDLRRPGELEDPPDVPAPDAEQIAAIPPLEPEAEEVPPEQTTPEQPEAAESPEEVPRLVNPDALIPHSIMNTNAVDGTITPETVYYDPETRTSYSVDEVAPLRIQWDQARESMALNPTQFETQFAVEGGANGEIVLTPTGMSAHPDAPEGMLFTTEQAAAASARWQEQQRAQPQPRAPETTPLGIANGPRPGAERTTNAGHVFPPRPDAARRQQQPRQRWEVNPADYIGIRAFSLPEVLQNPARQQLFGELLHALAPDDVDLFGRVTQTESGALSEADQRTIFYALHELPKRLQQVESVSSRLKQSDILLIMKRDERFNQMATMLGVSNMAAILKNELPHMAMRDGDSATQLAKSFDGLLDDRKSIRYRHWESRVRKFCAKKGIAEEDFHILDTIEGRDAMKEKLSRRYKEGASTFMRTMDWVGTSIGFESQFNERARWAMEKAETLQEDAVVPPRSIFGISFDRVMRAGSTQSLLIDHIDPKLQSITAVLAETISDSAVKRRLLAGAFRNEPVTTSEQFGPDSYATMKREREAISNISAQNLQQAFDRDKALHRTTDGRAWAAMSDAEKTDFRDNTWNPAELQPGTKSAKGRGFWASVFSAFFTQFLAAKRNTVRV